MPPVTVENTLVLARIPRPDLDSSRSRPVTRIVDAEAGSEGAGVPIRRAFPGALSMAEADPFLLLDHAGPTMNGPGEAKGAAWHPHRGFETVTYMLDGELAHRDTTGGGGVIAEGETQWMTAGGGIQHEELPTEQLYRAESDRLAADRAGAAEFPWVALPCALLALVVLVRAQRMLSRRTRRTFNIGLVGATLAVLAMVVWTGVAWLAGTSHLVASERDGSAQVELLAKARIAALN